MGLKLYPIFILFTINSIIAQGQNDSTKIILNNQDTASKNISIIWECLPTYDAEGNVYKLQYRYNHIPDKQDTLEFEAKCKKDISDMIREVKEKEKQSTNKISKQPIRKAPKKN